MWAGGCAGVRACGRSQVGKKKYRDIQFFTEVVDASEALDGGGRGGGRNLYDPDELDEEQRERALRARLNAAFKAFTVQVEGVMERHGGPDRSFDIPYRELGFFGTPFKEMVFIQPSVHALVNLSERPVLCVSLSEVEHVHFERVMFSSKYFDMVIVFKDLTVPVQQISAIEMKELEKIQARPPPARSLARRPAGRPAGGASDY